MSYDNCQRRTMSMKLTGTKRQADRRTGGQDHILSQTRKMKRVAGGVYHYSGVQANRNAGKIEASKKDMQIEIEDENGFFR